MSLDHYAADKQDRVDMPDGECTGRTLSAQSYHRGAAAHPQLHEAFLPSMGLHQRSQWRTFPNWALHISHDQAGLIIQEPYSNLSDLNIGIQAREYLPWRNGRMATASTRSKRRDTEEADLPTRASPAHDLDNNG